MSVPTPTLPCNRVVTMDGLPSITVLLPRPMALLPMTIWFSCPEAFALLEAPMKMELVATAFWASAVM